MSLTRRGFLKTAGGAALLPLLPAPDAAFAATPPPLDSSFSFTPRARDVLRTAANRLIPPFRNDHFNGVTAPVFRGAGEEGAVGYIENLLQAFNPMTDPSGQPMPPRIYPSVRGHDDPPGSFLGSHGGPSECEGGHLMVPTGWLPLPPEKELGWRLAIARFQEAYRKALGRLDAEGEHVKGQLDVDAETIFGQGFVEIRPAEQTLLLEAYDGASIMNRLSGVYSSGGGEPALASTYSAPANPRADFFNLLFHHTMEGVYGDPIYRDVSGQNQNRIAWQLAGFGGPRHPEGYYPEELENRAVCDRGVPGNFGVLDDL